MSRKLSLYNAKRDFSKTQEPAGHHAKKISSRDSQLRFVVQKHAARRLHYDFRLELNGVMKSWAVTRGPSTDPIDKRLAVEVEDHPLAYGDFEGTIPAGQYGGGTVQLWDRGYWRPTEEESPQASLAAGELKFELFGERLNGSWVLVRMRNDRNVENSARNNWLLIKHRDTDHRVSAAARKLTQQAALALLMLDASIASGRSMATIALGKGKAPTTFINQTTRKQSGRNRSTTSTRKRSTGVTKRSSTGSR